MACWISSGTKRRQRWNALPGREALSGREPGASLCSAPVYYRPGRWPEKAEPPNPLRRNFKCLWLGLRLRSRLRDRLTDEPTHWRTDRPSPRPSPPGEGDAPSSAGQLRAVLSLPSSVFSPQPSVHRLPSETGFPDPILVSRPQPSGSNEALRAPAMGAGQPARTAARKLHIMLSETVQRARRSARQHRICLNPATTPTGIHRGLC